MPVNGEHNTLVRFSSHPTPTSYGELHVRASRGTSRWINGWEILCSPVIEGHLSTAFAATILAMSYILAAADNAAVRFLNFKRLLRASGLGRVPLASHRQTVDADTPRRWANSACDSLPRSRLISSPVITDTSLHLSKIHFDCNNRRAATEEEHR
jgi:hypothetical protein